MPLKVYGTIGSPSVRTTVLALKALNLDYEWQEVKPLAGEHLTEEYLKINPSHTIPSIVDDDGFVVYDSHAINAYLVHKYADNDDLYPAEHKARSMVDRIMFYDSGVMFPCFINIAMNLIVKKTTEKITDEMAQKCEDIYRLLEKYLDGREYIASNNVTIADFSVIATLTTLDIFVAVDKEQFPLVAAYMERCKTNLPGYEEANQTGVDLFKNFIVENLNLQLR